MGVLSVWMLTQGYELPQSTAILASTPLHIILNIILVYGWGGNLAGAAVAGVLTRTFRLGYVVAHVCMSRLHDRFVCIYVCMCVCVCVGALYVYLCVYV